MSQILHRRTVAMAVLLALAAILLLATHDHGMLTALAGHVSPHNMPVEGS